MATTLPRQIHYCWFGPKSLSALNFDCGQTWRYRMPGYDIVQWNEKNLPRGLTPTGERFLETALSNGKWTNASNLVRMVVMAEYGGIYLDTDMEMLQSLEPLWHGEELILGRETNVYVNTAAMIGVWPCRAATMIADQMLADFDGTEEANRSGPILATDVLREDFGLIEDSCCVKVLPQEAFYPIAFRDRHNMNKIREARENADKSRYLLHHWEGTWLSK